jgi:spermidine synthase
VTQPGAKPTIGDRFAIAITSGACVALQVALTRVFSITLWHHFAYLVVGLALLGFGVAGAWLAARDQPETRSARDMPVALARRASVAAIAGWISVLAAMVMRPNALELFRSPSVAFSLTLMVVLCAVPFLGGGVVLGTALSRWEGRAGTVYAWDLVGGGLAGTLAALVIPAIGALGLAAACMSALAFAGVLFGWRTAVRRRTLGATIAIVAASILFLRDEDSWIVPAPTKEISLAHRPDVGIRAVDTRVWTLQGRVDLLREVKTAPLVAGEVNARTGLWRSHPLTQDGAAPTAIYAVTDDPAELAFLPHASTAAVWHLRGASFGPRGSHPANGPRVLIIGVGGGIDIMNALAHGASHVTGAEINPGIRSLLTGPYAGYSGNLASRDDVSIVLSEGRAFVRSSLQKFDVIQLAGVDTFTALASGAYSLAEAYVYTQQAFDDYFAHLAPGGCVSVSRLILDPPRETLRLAVTAAKALERRRAAEPFRHITVLRGKVWATMLACENPIAPEALQRLRDFAAAEGFSLAFDPDRLGDDPWSRALAGAPEERAAFVASYRFRIDPPTDEAPFFFNFYRLRNLAVLPRLSSTEMVYGTVVPIGHGVMLVSLLVTAIAAAFGILRPLRAIDAGALREVWRSLVYFGGLGVAYLLVEVGLLQRMTFLLGDPTTALAFVLCALLIASGVGAALTRRMVPTHATRWLLVALPLVVSAAALASWTLIPRAVGAGFVARSAVALAVVVPCGLLMGMPFPIGIERVRAVRARLVPWAFGVNAFLTVVTSAAAPLLALDTGLSALLLIAAMVYAVALAIGRKALA